MVLIRSVITHFLLLVSIQSLLFNSKFEKDMRVHPIQTNNTLIHYRNPTRKPGKNLRRLPHIFSRVLELPLRSEANVSVEEKPDCFRFAAETTEEEKGRCSGGDMRACTVEIHPGITKIVVRTKGSSSSSLGLSLDELELDVWRFRLPESTRPELVTVVCEDGGFVVTVPKIVTEEEEDGDFRQGMGSGRLVFVQ